MINVTSLCFQVVEILEEDEDFKKKLHNATEEDIRSGLIADRMDLVSHNVRTKLDELKRMEIEYQRRLRKQERDHLNGINERNFWNPLFDENSETFESEDLRKLLHKVNSFECSNCDILKQGPPNSFVVSW